METIVQSVGGRLEIDGTSYECAQVAATYGINSVPTATASLAVGVDVKSGKVSEAHKGLIARSKSGYMVPAKLFLSLNGNEQKIFEGYLTGTGYNKQQGRLNLVVQLSGWLIDLAFTTTVIETTQAANAGLLIYDAAYPPGTGADGGNGDGIDGTVVFTSGSTFDGKFASHKDDIAAAILDIFYYIAKHDILAPAADAIKGEEACFASNDSLKNTVAIKALDRIFTKGGVGKSGNLSGAVAAAFGADLDDLIFDSLATALFEQCNESWWTTSVWDKLIGLLAPQLQLILVPLVDQALLVPFCPVISKIGGTIKATEIAAMQFSAQVPRPLRGIGIVAGVGSDTGANGSNDSDSLTLGGCYGDKNATGAVVFCDVPRWLAYLPSKGDNDPGKTAIGAKEGDNAPQRNPTPTATTPGARGDEDNNRQQEISDMANPLYTSLAKSRYFQEMFRGRRGVVTTNLRWDVAPGSILRFETLPALTMQNNKLENANVVGVVERVTIWGDAEGSNAGTMFNVAYCRTDQENQGMGTAEHPLYPGKPFTGAKLIAGDPGKADEGENAGEED